MSTSEKTAVFSSYIAELHRAVHAVGLFLENRLGGSLSQAEVLVIIHLAAQPSTINDLHRAFLHKRSTLTSVLDRLEKRALLRRVVAASDRRSVGITLTAGGRRVAVEIASALRELQIEVDASWPLTELDVTRVRNVAERASALF